MMVRMEMSKRGKSMDNLTAASTTASTAAAAAVATVQQENDVLLGRLAAVQQVK
jgi:hypothetical protein